eukprot:TRINITY_DN15410_c0_g1_i1.p1 TRINITY_DN15410_c0_g1~~TRINITY_DN15410_c0_g1_i1.p1  ORF type:complete len:351 (+),score=85.47 TRINITY_DN15410_c0_g1_i1:283-1335(+)
MEDFADCTRFLCSSSSSSSSMRPCSPDVATRLEIRCKGRFLARGGIDGFCAWLEGRLGDRTFGQPLVAWADFTGCALQDAGVERLADCFSCARIEVERLWLRNCFISPGAENPLRQLASSPILREVRLDGNRLNDDSVTGLLHTVAEVAQASQAGPVWVCLAGNAICDPPAILEQLRKDGVDVALQAAGAEHGSYDVATLVLPRFCDQPLAPGGSNGSGPRKDAAFVKLATHRLVEALHALADAEMAREAALLAAQEAADTPPVSAEAATAAAAAALAAVREATQPASHRSALTPATRVGLKTAWDPYLAGQGQQSATNLAAAAAGRQFENRGAQELSQPAPKRRRQAAS